MLANISKLFGAVLLVVGILGFVPAFTPDGHLLGIFHVNAFHNMVHVLSGVAALAAGFTGYKYSKLYFQVFGVVYALVAVLGVFYGNDPILGLIAHNYADLFLHIAIATTALTLGFGNVVKDEHAATA
jgi:hypothetical protein